MFVIFKYILILFSVHIYYIVCVDYSVYIVEIFSINNIFLYMPAKKVIDKCLNMT